MTPLLLDHKPVELRLRHTWTIARNSSRVKRNVLTRLRHGGTDGYGEAAPNPRYGEDAESVARALDTLAPRLPDDPGRLDAILDRVEAALPSSPAARAAIDIALYDWAGRVAGQPLYRLLGTDPRRTPSTSLSIGIDAIPVMQEKVREAGDAPVLKIKVGLTNDREILEGIRSVTGKPLWVDANEGWTDPALAVEMIRWMQGMGVVLVEQPLPAADLEGARFVRERVDLPVYADEAALAPGDIPRLAEAFDGINIKLQKAGGLRAARRMIDAARESGLKVMLGCMIETSIGITAAAHLSPLADLADLDGHLLIADDPFDGVQVRQGRLFLPDRPGLGVLGAW
jgi:L-alanine-DL-glutamate epimerase-like enolase superfamily enzyme